MDTEQMKKLFLEGLRSLSEKHTEETLGDRTTYLGASDIGYCPRKVIMERINKPEHDLATLLRFKRGHLAEDVVAEIYDSIGFSNYDRQVEIDISTEIAPILVHIDFVFTSEKHKVKSILEVKSGSIPDSPYENWETQLYLQMGALAMKYPDYEIRGAIISLDLSEGDIAFFNSYTPNEMIFEGLIKRAESIWQWNLQVQNGEQVEIDLAPGPLCGFCSAIRTCPIFEKIKDFPDPDMDGYINEFQGYRENETLFKNRVRNHKDIILRMVKTRGPFQAGGFIFRQTSRKRKELDKARLAKFLSENGSSLPEFEEVSDGRPFLDIKPVKSTAKAPQKKAA